MSEKTVISCELSHDISNEKKKTQATRLMNKNKYSFSQKLLV